MVIEKMDEEKITVSFSGKVGKDGLKQIKQYIEYLEKASTLPKVKVPKATINKIADEIKQGAWERFKKAKGLE